MAKFDKADLNKDGKVMALYMTGNTNPKDLIAAGVAAVAPVILKALNPNDKSFGFQNK